MLDNVITSGSRKGNGQVCFPTFHKHAPNKHKYVMPKNNMYNLTNEIRCENGRCELNERRGMATYIV